ncbi:hypothetical protein [Ferruginibacter sp.]
MDNNHPGLLQLNVSFMQLKILLLLLAICCLACNNGKAKKEVSETTTAIEFDTTKWRTKDGDDYPYRDELLTYLITNNKLKGWKKDSVVALLGQPDKIDSNYLFYSIAQNRIGFFPLHTKTLVIKLAADSTVEWRKIHE